MGQGHYNAIIYGCLDPDIDEIVNGYTEVAEWAQEAIDNSRARLGIEMKTGYESDRQYLGVVLWVSDECLAGRWRVEPLGDRSTCSLNELVVLMEARSATDTPVYRAWDELRSVAAEHGRSLPEGQLLFVTDFD